MKKKILLATALLIFISLELQARPHAGISFNFFYSSLRPYGEWIQIDNDLVVWRPHGIHNRWRPYSDGRWSWTSHGWYWDSYEPFGWATYHYGRWYYDNYYGWIWIPGYEWGPSWVEWRYGSDYIGWAPLPPYASFSFNLGIHFSIGWHSSYNYWNFVPYNRFYDHRLNYYILDGSGAERIFGHTKYRTNYYSDRDRIINGGVDKSFIERKAGYRIAEREIASVDNYNDFNRVRRDRSDRVYVYRPSEREVNNGRTVDRYDFKRGENSSTIERDRIGTPFTRGGERDFNDRTTGRNRDSRAERDAAIRDNGRLRDDVNRDIERERDQFRRESERERIRIENERPESRARDRLDYRAWERTNREPSQGRQPVYERPSRSERPYEFEKRVETSRERSFDRPSQN
ncbi:MAG: DUF6600 domain-containing protein, partial [Bacteroidota bacterium]